MKMQRLGIKKLLGTIEAEQVKNLPKLKRNEVLRKVKVIDGISHRQIARILGVSPNLILKGIGKEGSSRTVPQLP